MQATWYLTLKRKKKMPKGWDLVVLLLLGGTRHGLQVPRLLQGRKELLF